MPAMTDIPDHVVAPLVAAMERDGIAMLPAFLDAGELEALQQLVYARVETFGEQAGFSGAQAINQTALGEVSQAPVLPELLRKIYALGVGRAAPEQAMFQIMRCLKGRSGLKHSLIFHYDSYFLTALLPIVIPEGGASGHLLMLPNVRRFGASYLRNLFDKILLDNPVSQAVLGRRYRDGKLTEIVMRPGSLYLFWGYRTIHANAPCDPQNIRATALFHFGDPYADSRLRRVVRRMKNLPAG